jgi:hypothetical protein
MTKGRAVLPARVVAEQDPFSSPWLGPLAHDSSVENVSKRKHPHRDLSTTLPRISCRDSWRWGSACGSLYGEPHTWTSLAARSRKSGYAPVEMTKGRAALPERVVAGQEPFFITLGGPKAHDSSVEKRLRPSDFEWVAQVRAAPPSSIPCFTSAGNNTHPPSPAATMR